MISHWESVRYAGKNLLGVATLLAALMAMVYTTASESLVAPNLKFGKPYPRLIYGKVSASFANAAYIMDQCNTPISPLVDPEYSGQTCVSIEHPGQAYHNYVQYLTTWVDDINSGNSSDDLAYRPAPVGIVSTIPVHIPLARQSNALQDVFRAQQSFPKFLFRLMPLRRTDSKWGVAL